jgi:DNA repair protein RecN (Recombination protein N)
MFKKLTIEQFVIIDHLELDFQTGLTIVTGETGAGKSILLDATGLILGDPPSPDSIRAGAEQSVIKAIFSPPSNHPVWQFMREQGLVGPGQQEFPVYRATKTDGTETILVNDKPVELEKLKQLGTYLVEIHGQFANQSLLAPANQLNLLDLSGNFPPEVFKNVADALHDVHRYTRELDEENHFLNTHKRLLPRIEAVVREFQRIEMKEGFEIEVRDEYTKLLIAKETSEAFQAILAQLIAANGVVMGLQAANNILERNPNLEAEKMVHLSGFLGVALENARFAVKEMRRLAPDYDIDTRPLEKYTALINAMHKICKENKVEFENLSEFFKDQTWRLERIKNGRNTIARLQDALAKAKRAYIYHSHILHEKRVVAGVELSKAITAELPPLKLMKAQFEVDVKENPNIPWTEKGLDEVTFKARMNPGMPFSPVAETASGGELARLILALKVVVQEVQTIPTLIFDEVDTGIGGAAAAAVGERLAQLADSTQVLVITHSAQVASRGHQHLHVSKETDGVTTRSIVKKLTLDQSIDEISRMLAGEVITAESRAAAKSLRDEALTAAEVRKTKRTPPPPASSPEPAETANL